MEAGEDESLPITPSAVGGISSQTERAAGIPAHLAELSEKARDGVGIAGHPL